MIIGNCELGKKSKHSLPEKVGDPLKYTHTLLNAFKNPAKKHNP